MAVIDSGSSTAGKANVDAQYNLQVTTPGHTSAGVERGGGPENGPALFVENDPGEITGVRYVRSPEVDEDYRLRIATDHILDRETFNYAAQNTGKHSHAFTTVTATVGTNGLLLNSGSGVATATGMTFGTFAEFPVGMAATSVYCETNLSINQAQNAISANAVIDVGMFRRGASTAFAPTDGVYFRFTSAGVSAVINNTTTETVLVLPATGFLANTVHKYAISITEREAEFWIDDVRYGSLDATSTNAQLFRSATLPWSVRYANTGAVSGAVQATITDYTISHGGAPYVATLSQTGNRSLGAYQGLSGNTMGSLAVYANNTNPTAGAGTNTAVIVGGSQGVGGQFLMTAQVTGATDNIISTYQNPAGTIAVQGRRMAVYGVKIDAVNFGAAVATTPTTLLLAMTFGNTAISLATAETGSFVTATAKAARRVALGFMNWPVAATIGAQPDRGAVFVPFTQPVYVNPGEFIGTSARFVQGTATASQAIFFTVAFDYGWE